MLFNSIKSHFPFSILLQKVYSILEKKKKINFCKNIDYWKKFNSSQHQN